MQIKCTAAFEISCVGVLKSSELRRDLDIQLLVRKFTSALEIQLLLRNNTAAFQKVYSCFSESIQLLFRKYTAAFQKVYSCSSEISSVGVLKSRELCRDRKGGEHSYDALSL